MEPSEIHENMDTSATDSPSAKVAAISYGSGIPTRSGGLKRGRPKNSGGASTAARIANLELLMTNLTAECSSMKKCMEQQALLIEQQGKLIERLLAGGGPAGPSDLSLSQQKNQLNITYASALNGGLDRASEVAAKLKLASDVKSMVSKSFLAVIENLPDSWKDDQLDIDKSFFESFSNSSPSLPKPIEFFLVKCEKKSYARPTKVRFDSQSNRDLYIREFHKCLSKFPSRLSAVRPIRCRRDMTRDELSLLRIARKTAYDANQKANQIQFVVRDLIVHELSTPRPFPSNSSVTSSNSSAAPQK